MINSHNVTSQVLISKQSVSKFAEGEDKVSKLLCSCEYFPSISQSLCRFNIQKPQEP